jgi:hypothetical protein
MKWWGRHSEEDEAEDTRRLVQHAAELHGVPTSEVVHAVLDDEDDDIEDTGRRRSHKGAWITLVVVGAMFGLVIVGLMKLANTADQAGPTAVSGLEDLKKSIEPTPQVNPTMSGTHIIFTYPAVFDLVTHPANWSNTTERYELASKSDYRKSIQVYVENAAFYTADSGYLFRSAHPTDYKPSSVKVMGETAVIMVKADNSERTLYWPHAGQMVIMSATGEGSLLQSWLDVISTTLRWVQ